MKTTRTKPFRPQADTLETRMMLDGSGDLPTPISGPPTNTGSIPVNWIRSYYGLDAAPDGTSVPLDGKGQTVITICTDRDASFRNSDGDQGEWLGSGLAQYSKATGLPYNANGTDSDFSFQMVSENGDTSFNDLPAAAYTNTPDDNDSDEFSMDIEAVHLAAPDARIISIVPNSLDTADMDQAIATALTYSPAAISISINLHEDDSDFNGLTDYSGFVDRNGITYLQSSGDNGAGIQYDNNDDDDDSTHFESMQGNSSLVIMVGGTTMNPGPGATYVETAWGNGEFSDTDRDGSGGGYSQINARTLAQQQSPAVQANEANYPTGANGMRLGPDISMLSDPGIDLLNTRSGGKNTPNGTYEWSVNGGTSLATPLLAGLMAVVGEGRSLDGLPALSSTDTQNFMYQLPADDFHDINTGNNGYAATPGFDLATGLGTPTPKFINDLVAATYPTTTTVTAAQAAGGSTLTMTAHIAPTYGARTASGLVIFTDNGHALNPVELDDNGNATFVEQGAAVGNHDVQAQLVGSGFFATSTGTAQAAVVAPTTTTLAAISPIIGANQPVTLTAAISAPFGSASLTGLLVSFFDGATLLGLAPVDASGRAMFTTTGLTAPGVRSIRAAFAGSDFFTTSTSDARALIIAASTTTTLAVQPGDMASGGQPLTLTATVTAQAGSTMPTGSVSFYDGTTLLGTDEFDGTDRASITTTPAALGVHALRAVFAGSPFALTSTSTSVPLVVAPIATITAVAAAAGDLVGRSRALTLNATVAAGPGSPTITGVVDFAEDGLFVGSGQLDGQGHASITLTSSAAGTHQVTATYAGAGLFGGSTSGTGSVAIDPAATTTSLVAASLSVLIKQPIRLTATVAGPGGPSPAGGTVTFWDNGQVVATSILDANGVATAIYTPATVGTHSLLATFGGSGLLEASSSPVGSMTVLAQPTATSLRVLSPSVLTASNPVVLASSVVMADGTTPAGATIRFWDNGQVVGSAQVGPDGQATFAYTPGGGVHYLTAGFAGSDLAAASLSPLGAVAVMPAATTTTLVARPSGAATTLMATVTSAGATPAGVVEFRDGTRILSRQALDTSGRATVAVRISPKGVHQVTAVFEGSGDFATSQAVGSTSRVRSASRRVAIRAAVATPAGPRAAHKAAARSVAEHH